MSKEEILDKLMLNHRAFTGYILSLRDEDLIFSLNNNKWSAGQQADHIYRSLSPLKFILGLPKWLLRLIFRRANRPSKSYEKLLEKYRQRLESGGRASGRFVPVKKQFTGKEVCGKIDGTLNKLCRSVRSYSEEELDQLVLPHPLLGKVTLREMLYFTIYHVEHHLQITRRDLSSR